MLLIHQLVQLRTATLCHEQQVQANGGSYGSNGVDGAGLDMPALQPRYALPRYPGFGGEIRLALSLALAATSDRNADPKVVLSH